MCTADTHILYTVQASAVQGFLVQQHSSKLTVNFALSSITSYPRMVGVIGRSSATADEDVEVVMG